MKQNSSSLSAQQGVALVEAMVAILIFSIGVLAIVGLQTSMLKNTSDSKFRADASFIAQQRISSIWTDPANMVNYAENATIIAPLLPSGTRTTAVIPSPTGVQVTVTVTWQPPGEAQHTYITIASIAGN